MLMTGASGSECFHYIRVCGSKRHEAETMFTYVNPFHVPLLANRYLVVLFESATKCFCRRYIMSSDLQMQEQG